MIVIAYDSYRFRNIRTVWVVFNVQSFNGQPFDVQSSDVQSFNVLSVNHKICNSVARLIWDYNIWEYVVHLD